MNLVQTTGATSERAIESALKFLHDCKQTSTVWRLLKSSFTSEEDKALIDSLEQNPADERIRGAIENTLRKILEKDPELTARLSLLLHRSVPGKAILRSIDIETEGDGEDYYGLDFTGQADSDPTPDYAVIRVYYATDRHCTFDSNPSELFGANRDQTLSVGYCDVSMPRDHRMGELESPSVLRLQFHGDPEKHVTLLSAVISPNECFYKSLAIQVAKSKKKAAFIFVHGYNVTFEDAARRTAQISYDLAFDGAPMFYSWPSQGTTSAYTVDEQNIEWSQVNLKQFLEEFFEKSDAQNVYLIAHSMGNRAMTRAVAALLADKPFLRTRLQEVILAAPDIDAGVFKRDIAPALVATGRPVTLYASSDDLAMVASKKIHGNSRAGDSGPGLVVVHGIETIDATNVDTNLLGHSYFAEARSLLSDMFYLINDSQRADQRFGLRRIDVIAGPYWEFKA